MFRQLPLFLWLNGPAQHRIGVAIFQQAIGLAIVFRLVTELPFALFLWGPRSLSAGNSGDTPANPIDRWADLAFSSDASTYAFLTVLGIGALGLLVQRCTRIATVVTCICFTILGFRLGALNDGGDNLATLALLYMVFLLPARVNAPAGSIRSWLHNLGVLSLAIQICIVYFVAGFMKMHGEAWHNGTALYLISQVEWFSSPSTRSWFADPVVATAGAYSTMFFQVWFPIAFFSRFKLMFVAAAMFFHVGIAVSMGLLTFSTVMAGADLCLLSDEDYRGIQTWVRRFKDRLRAASDQAFAPSILFIDGHCRFCRRFAANVRRLDVANRVSIESFRDSTRYEAYGITAGALQNRMHLVVVGRTTIPLAGFDALRMLCWRLPLLWIALPVIGVVGGIGLGDTFYDFVASRRKIDSQGSCDESCSLQRDS